MEHKFENPTAIKASIEKLKSFDLNDNNFHDLVTLYVNEIGTVPFYPIKQKKGTVLFRARRNQGDLQNLFKGLTEIGLKPKELVKEYGRANIPNQSMFYCSTNEETVTQEINQWYINDEGRFQDLVSKGGLVAEWHPFNCFLTISAWYLKSGVTIALLFGNEKQRPLGVQEAKAKKDTLEHTSSNYRESWEALIDLFSHEFSKTNVKHQYDYKLSSLYTYLVLNSENDNCDKVCGVKYASIANHYRGENIALDEECFKKNIGFIGANFCVAHNNVKQTIDEDITCIVGKDYTAVLNKDSSFGYIDASEDWDYLMNNGKRIDKMIFPNGEGKRFVRTIKRLPNP